MIWLSFSTWVSKHDSSFIMIEFILGGYRWAPFIQISKRYGNRPNCLNCKSFEEAKNEHVPKIPQPLTIDFGGKSHTINFK